MTTRNVCFTSFNLECAPILGDVIKYAVYQHEKCPETERLHVQGYLEFSKSLRYAAIKKLLGDPAVHLEARRGTREQAIEYCKKEESRIDGPWEYGDAIRSQGKHTDLELLADAIKANPKMDVLVDDHLTHLIKYPRGVANACFLLNKRQAKMFRQLEVHVYWGAAGTGKTRKAVERDSDYYILEKSGDALWFDGYDGEDHLIIDDFYGWIPFNQLLRILDGYMFKCNIKGSFVYAQWTKITITSNKNPDLWYNQDKLNDNMRNAFYRRIHEIKEFISE